MEMCLREVARLHPGRTVTWVSLCLVQIQPLWAEDTEILAAVGGGTGKSQVALGKLNLFPLFPLSTSLLLLLPSPLNILALELRKWNMI